MYHGLGHNITILTYTLLISIWYALEFITFYFRVKLISTLQVAADVEKKKLCSKACKNLYPQARTRTLLLFCSNKEFIIRCLQFPSLYCIFDNVFYQFLNTFANIFRFIALKLKFIYLLFRRKYRKQFYMLGFLIYKKIRWGAYRKIVRI